MIAREKKVRGKIKWFSERLGYGFIVGDDGRDYFVHHTGFICRHTGDLNLHPGGVVVFTAVGARAENVKPIDK